MSLEPVDEADRDRIFEWRNLPEVARWMFSNDRIAHDEHTAWFARMLTKPRQRYWLIFWRAQPVGVVNLTAISDEHRRSEFGIYLAEASARGTGAADGATFLSLDCAFGALRLKRVTCEALADNHRAIALYQRMGFRREAHLRSHIRRGDEYLDVVCLGLLASDWATLRPGLFERLVARGVLLEEVDHR